MSRSWEDQNAKSPSAPVPAAEYVRMSTEHQQYSTQNQGATIRNYARERGYEIVRTYADDGKSGLRIEGRTGLKALLHDVQSGNAPFLTVLVYDISRWGRFQDADESAYYEYICRRAGLNVVYCAEQFENDGSPTATIIKSVKRAMAGEYSRELSVKVFAGQCRLVELGYRQGGVAGFGLRRQLLDQSGQPKGELQNGERKSIQTDRVVLVPGPLHEIDVVRRIFQSCRNGLRPAHIASELNADGIPSSNGRPWTRAVVHGILTSEKYIGTNVFNRRSFKLKRKHVENPPEMWVRKESAFEAIVSKELFQEVQTTLTAWQQRPSDDEIIAMLRQILTEHGRLSASIINASGVMRSATVGHRFNGLHRAYAQVGYRPTRSYEFLEINQRLRNLYPQVIAETVRRICQAGGEAEADATHSILSMNGELLIAIALSRCRETPHGRRSWRLRINPEFRTDIVIAVRLDATNTSALDYYLLPKYVLDRPKLQLGEFNDARIESFRTDSLECLAQLAARATFRRSV